MVEAAMAAGIVLLALVLWGPRGLAALERRRLRRLLANPRTDPLAAEVDEARRQRLTAVLDGIGIEGMSEDEAWARLHAGDAVGAAAGFRSLPAPRSAVGLSAAALTVCRIGPRGWAWRQGLRRAIPLVEAGLASDPADLRMRGVAAQIWAALGEMDRSRALVDTLPVDDWRGCLARSVLYDHGGDRGRSFAALAAAAQLAPEAQRLALQSDLAAVRDGRSDPRWAL